MPDKLPLVIDFKKVDKGDILLVGGKGSNLGEMTKAGFPVPPGFVVTSESYWKFLEENHLRNKISDLLKGLDVHRSDELTRISHQIKDMIVHGSIPEDISEKIIKSYLELGNKTLVAVRSSATAEDLPDASFAGQQDTFLNIVGESNVVDYVRKAWASLFTPRAIFYREQKKFDHFKVGIAVPIQKMIQSEVSGVMFTVNPVNQDKSVIIIEAVLGLGEMIVQGSVTPDHYEVLKRNLEISKKTINRQTRIMVKNIKDHLAENEVRILPIWKQKSQKLSDKYVVEAAKLGMALYQHYFFPQDVEWALEKGKIYIIQTRPITTLENKIYSEESGKIVTKGLTKILTGQPASPGLVSGPVRLIKSVKEIHNVKPGDILVMEMTSPDFVPAMRKAVAVVTDQGGQTSHAAIVSRELGVVCVVGTQIATKKLKNGSIVTVNGTNGEVFAGAFQKTPTAGSSDSQIVRQSESPSVQSVPNFSNFKTATKVYVNLAEPELAEKIAAENVDGIGLLRAEFMIAQIGIHPKKFIQDKKTAEFVDALKTGLTKFAQAFYPRPVVYRATDFRTNEYRNLKGGDRFEPVEPNPMLGFRGASRYIVDSEVFELELKAIREVREKFNNLHLMIPFVRSVNELKEVKKIVYGMSLRRSQNFQFWMMTELPVNVISIDDFLDVGIDGISIGTNDLTMLTLGTDRDNENVAKDYDEMNSAVLWSLKRLITSAAKRGVTSSICGQAPSIYPELVEELVKWGITSVSISPDRINTTRKLIYEAERKNLCH
ncbi:phosphoenolpyruvate synthase [Candidatus Collierbacteria bacterium]|nr:phosphoenolpyruvate synthase [Candidatus Collierbacteria bacterium]